MSSRSKILSSLYDSITPATNPALPVYRDDDFFLNIPISTDRKAVQEVFAERFRALKGEFHFVEDFESARNEIRNIVSPEENRSIFVEDTELVRNVLGGDKTNATETINRHSASRDGVDSGTGLLWGITAADMLVARTGSIILGSSKTRSRRSFCLVPNHVVIATPEQIVPTLDEALDTLSKRDNGASLTTIVSGPSRTSDIEKNLVLGAHGPRRLILILIKRT